MIFFKHQFSIESNLSEPDVLKVIERNIDQEKRVRFRLKNRKPLSGKISKQEFTVVRNSFGQWPPRITGKAEELDDHTVIHFQIEQTEGFYIFLFFAVLLISIFIMATGQTNISTFGFMVFSVLVFYVLCLLGFFVETRKVKQEFEIMLTKDNKANSADAKSRAAD